MTINTSTRENRDRSARIAHTISARRGDHKAAPPAAPTRKGRPFKLTSRQAAAAQEIRRLHNEAESRSLTPASGDLRARVDTSHRSARLPGARTAYAAAELSALMSRVDDVERAIVFSMALIELTARDVVGGGLLKDIGVCAAESEIGVKFMYRRALDKIADGLGLPR